MIKPIDILIVDDRPDGLLALETILKSSRYHIVKASSGFEALDMVKKYQFAVILLDVQMPEIDGFETAKRIKLLPDNKSTPIIFVTAISKDEEYIFRGYQSGAVDYIFKPVDDTIVRSKVAVFADLFEKSKKIEEQAEKIRTAAAQERFLRLAQLEVESLRRYQNLANSIPHAIWRAKPDGTMDYFNRGWINYTGLTEQQSTGLGWQAAVHPDDLKSLLKNWMDHMGSSKEFEVECRLKTIHSEWCWNIIRVVAEVGTRGEVIAWLGTCTDIHERKLAEEKVYQAQLEANAASNAKTNFLANMSHEIRTPLNAILGYTELMLTADSVEQDVAKNLSTIMKNGTSLLKIIDEILDISKVESGFLEIENIETDLPRLLTDIYLLLDVKAQEKSLEFKFNCTTQIPDKVMTDPTRLRQILVNILGNSLKFTRKGFVKMDISWVPQGNSKTQGNLHFEITDSGIGIAEADQEKLFQPFVQVDGSKTRHFGGTGLGLALSQKLALAMGGRAFIKKSALDKGSVFVVEVKAELADGAKKIERLNHNIHEVIRPENLKNVLTGRRVLVVDDSSDNRNLITRFLIGAGAEVDCASDGHEGVEKALSHLYDVVLMDIQMPRLDGYQATAKLRSQGYAKPIIALTAHALKEERMNSQNAGCDDHLTKPIDRRTLIDQIMKHSQNPNKGPAGSVLIH